MIEYRAFLMKDRKFEGGFRLDKGTIIYVQETESGWLGMFYEPKGTAHGFALEEGDFSILTQSETGAVEHIVIPDPPDPPEHIQRRQDLERRRIRARINRHRQEANELKKLLA